MPDHITQIIGSLPFFLLTTEGHIKINKSRIIEAVIIAILGGLVAGYVSVKQLEVKMDILQKKVDKIYEDIYHPNISPPRYSFEDEDQPK